MRRLSALLAAMLFLLGLMAGPTLAQPPEHGHALLLQVEFDGPPAPGNLEGFDRCVELANGQALPLNAHHQQVHQGTAGEMLFTKAGHLVVPLAPLSDFGSCEDIEALLD